MKTDKILEELFKTIGVAENDCASILNLLEKDQKNIKSSLTPIIDDVTNVSECEFKKNEDRQLIIRIIKNAIIRNHNETGYTFENARADCIVDTTKKNIVDTTGLYGGGGKAMSMLKGDGTEKVYTRAKDNPGQFYSFIKNYNKYNFDVWHPNGELKYLIKGWTNKLVPCSEQQSIEYEKDWKRIIKENLFESILNDGKLDKITIIWLDGTQTILTPSLKKSQSHAKEFTIPENIDIPKIVKGPKISERKIIIEVSPGYGNGFNNGFYFNKFPGKIDVYSSFSLTGSRESIYEGEFWEWHSSKIEEFIKDLVLQGKLNILEVADIEAYSDSAYKKYVENILLFAKSEKVWQTKSGKLVNREKCRRKTGDYNMYIEDKLLESHELFFVNTEDENILNYFGIEKISYEEAREILEPVHLDGNDNDILEYFRYRRNILHLFNYIYDGKHFSKNKPQYYGNAVEEFELGNHVLVIFDLENIVHKFLKEEECLLPLCTDETTKKVIEKYNKLEGKERKIGYLRVMAAHACELNLELIKEADIELYPEIGEDPIKTSELYAKIEKFRGLVPDDFTLNSEYSNISETFLQQIGVEFNIVKIDKSERFVTIGKNTPRKIKYYDSPIIEDIQNEGVKDKVERINRIIVEHMPYYQQYFHHEVDEYRNDREKKEIEDKIKKLGLPRWIKTLNIVATNGKVVSPFNQNVYHSSVGGDVVTRGYIEVVPDYMITDNSKDFLKLLEVRYDKSDYDYFTEKIVEIHKKNKNNRDLKQYSAFVSERLKPEHPLYDLEKYGLLGKDGKLYTNPSSIIYGKEIPDVYKLFLGIISEDDFPGIQRNLLLLDVDNQINPKHIWNIIKNNIRLSLDDPFTIQVLKDLEKYIESYDYIKEIRKIIKRIIGNKEYFSSQELWKNVEGVCKKVIIIKDKDIIRVLSKLPFIKDWDREPKKYKVGKENTEIEFSNRHLRNFLTSRECSNETIKYSYFKIIVCDYVKAKIETKYHEVPFCIDDNKKTIYINEENEPSYILAQIFYIRSLAEKRMVKGILDDDEEVLEEYSENFEMPSKEKVKEEDWDVYDEDEEDEENVEEDEEDPYTDTNPKNTEYKSITFSPGSEYKQKENENEESLNKKGISKNKNKKGNSGKYADRSETGNKAEEVFVIIWCIFLSTFNTTNTEFIYEYDENYRTNGIIWVKPKGKGWDKFQLINKNSGKNQRGFDFLHKINQKQINRYGLMNKYGSKLKEKETYEIKGDKGDDRFSVDLSKSETKHCIKYGDITNAVLIWGFESGNIQGDIINDPIKKGKIKNIPESTNTIAPHSILHIY